MKNEMLPKAYGLDTAEKTREFYGEWAATYDAEITQNGYATPGRCAAVLAQFAADKAAPVLDIGCGTGISGAALKSEGFSLIDGCDFSAQMIEIAKLKNIYRQLLTTNLENPFPFEPGSYSAISAMGVLNPGHAPASTIDDVLALLPPDGLFVFSLNDHALEDHSYEARLNEQFDSGSARLLFKEYGDHLPKIDLNSTVYLLQKA